VARSAPSSQYRSPCKIWVRPWSNLIVSLTKRAAEFMTDWTASTVQCALPTQNAVLNLTQRTANVVLTLQVRPVGYVSNVLGCHTDSRGERDQAVDKQQCACKVCTQTLQRTSCFVAFSIRTGDTGRNRDIFATTETHFY